MSSWENALEETATPPIVSREEWERARAEPLAREKAHTHAGDEVAAARLGLESTLRPRGRPRKRLEK